MKGTQSGDDTRPGAKPALLAVMGRDTEELEDRFTLQGFPGFCELMPGCLSSARRGFLPGGSPGSPCAELPELWARPGQERGQLLQG